MKQLVFVGTLLLAVLTTSLAAAQERMTMTTAENKTVLQRLVDEVINTNELDLVDRFFREDFVDHNPSPGASPDVAGVKKSFALARAAFPDLRASVEDLVSEGDRVAYRWTFRGTNTGELQGNPPTGNPATWSTFGIVRIEDGKIAERWQLFDPASLRRQLGAGGAGTQR